MRRAVEIALLLIVCALCKAQTVGDTISTIVDSVSVNENLLSIKNQISVNDSLAKPKKDTIIAEEVSVPLYANFKPNPNTSLWLAMAIPGAGQIYNRKYWKLPIVYGLGVGVGYAIAYTNRNYQDYRNAYQTYNSSKPDPSLYKKLIPDGYPESSYNTYFKTQMDTYRRQRDLSIVAAVVVYALQVIDAFVDAQLSDFDVSPDLSIKVAPETQTVNNQQTVGVGAAVNF